MHHMLEATLYSTFPQAKGIHLTAPAYQIQPTTETANLRLLWRPSLNAHLSFDVSYVTGLVQRYLHSPTSSLLCSCLDVLRLCSASGTSNTALQVLTFVNVKDVGNKMVHCRKGHPPRCSKQHIFVAQSLLFSLLCRKSMRQQHSRAGVATQ